MSKAEWLEYWMREIEHEIRRREMLCDFCSPTSDLPKGQEIIIKKEEVIENGRAYIEMMIENRPEEYREIFTKHESFVRALYVTQIAKGFGPFASDWAVCKTCYLKWEEYKRRFPPGEGKTSETDKGNRGET